MLFLVKKPFKFILVEVEKFIAVGFSQRLIRSSKVALAQNGEDFWLKPDFVIELVPSAKANCNEEFCQGLLSRV